MKLELRDYQSAGLDGVRASFRAGKRRVLLVIPTGGGKCLGRGTEVLMFDGRRKRVEEIVVGDLLMGPDSRPRTVLSTTEGHGALRKVVPLRGEPWVCNDAHVLTLVHTETAEIVDVEIDEWRHSWSKWRRHLFKQFSVAVEFERDEPLPIDPYFLGVWFGDGTKHVREHGSAPGLTGIVVHKPDEEIAAACRDVASRWGCSLKTAVYNEACPAHFITSPAGKRNLLLEAMRKELGEGLEVPHRYLVSSRAERLAFLAGWVDTDGHVKRGNIDLVQKRRDYADAVCFLARSLGFRVAVAEKIVNGESYWRLSIAGDQSEIPTRIARKRGNVRQINKDVTRTGFSIEDLPSGPWHGFTLDGDGRFLLGNFVVTHNTVCAGALIEGAMNKGKKVCFLAHRKELIDQPSKMLDRLGIDHGVIKAGHWRTRPTLPVQVASIQTLARRGLRPDFDVLVLDEAHRRLAEMYEDVFVDYPKALILGLTATPCRLDGRGLGRAFEDMVVAATYSQLLERTPPAICQPRMFVHDVPELEDVPVSHGEYVRAKLGASLSGRIIGNIVKHWFEHARGRPTVCFAPTVDKSEEIVDNFRKQGIRAAHLDGKMDDGPRTKVLQQLEQGEIDVVSNVDLLVEGYDLPRLSALILARKTKSISRYLQMCGRVGRPDDSKEDALIFDHAMCYHEHGHPTDDRDWSLEDGYKSERTISLFFVCDVCFAVVPRGQKCPTCGSAKIREIRRGVAEETDDELVELKRQLRCRACNSERVTLTRGPGPFDMRLSCKQCSANTWSFDTKKAARASTEQRRVEFRRLLLVARKQNYAVGWAKHRYRECFGDFPDRKIMS